MLNYNNRQDLPWYGSNIHLVKQCCFAIGYGSLMVPRCLDTTYTCGEYEREKCRPIPGGGRGMKRGSCPKSAEEAHKHIQKSKWFI